MNLSRFGELAYLTAALSTAALIVCFFVSGCDLPRYKVSVLGPGGEIVQTWTNAAVLEESPERCVLSVNGKRVLISGRYLMEQE